VVAGTRSKIAGDAKEHWVITEKPVSSEQYHRLALLLARQELADGWVMVSSSANARVARNAAGTIYYKEFLPRGPLEGIKALLRGSRASRARYHNEALLRSGFDAPATIAWGNLPTGREYLFSGAVPGKGVTDWLQVELTERHGETLAKKRQLLGELGNFIGQFHASGFLHGDLRTSNILADYSNEAFHFALIDNERNTHQKETSARGMVRNLMQLNMLTPAIVSASDRMRFFTAWQRQMPALTRLERRIMGIEAYQWAMHRLREKGKLP